MFWTYTFRQVENMSYMYKVSTNNNPVKVSYKKGLITVYVLPAFGQYTYYPYKAIF